jgi:hypothetical protein
MLIAQLTDLHINDGGAWAYGTADTALSLEMMAQYLMGMRPRPDMAVITGDLADRGSSGAYRLIGETLEPLPFPIFALPGNHDHRETMLSCLPQMFPAPLPLTSGNLSYFLDEGSARFIMLDTVVPGSHSGALSPEAGHWLEEALSGAPNKPAMVFTHHPPFLSGLGELDEPFGGALRLASILARHPLALLCCGHLHRAISVAWEGGKGLVAPSLSLHIVLELSPSGGQAFTLGPPAFLLHDISLGRINSHFGHLPGLWPSSGPFRFKGQPKDNGPKPDFRPSDLEYGDRKEAIFFYEGGGRLFDGLVVINRFRGSWPCPKAAYLCPICRQTLWA